MSRRNKILYLMLLSLIGSSIFVCDVAAGGRYKNMTPEEKAAHKAKKKAAREARVQNEASMTPEEREAAQAARKAKKEARKEKKKKAEKKAAREAAEANMTPEEREQAQAKRAAKKKARQEKRAARKASGNADMPTEVPAE